MRSRQFDVLFFCAVWASSAHAGQLTYFADVSMFSTHWSNHPGNQQVALNLLGNGKTVLMSSQTGIGTNFTATGLAVFYENQHSIDFIRSEDELTMDLLAGVDLLVLDIWYTRPNPYDASEQKIISNFLISGRDVALIAESWSGTSLDMTANYNNLLMAIGSTMRTSGEYLHPGTVLADGILPVPLTAGVTSFQFGAANDIEGGVPAIQHLGVTHVAFELIVPEPVAIALLGLMGLLWSASRFAPGLRAGRMRPESCQRVGLAAAFDKDPELADAAQVALVADRASM